MNPLKYKIVILSVTALLFGLSLFYIPQMRAVYDFESFFPKNDPVFNDFEKYKTYFDSDENILMVAVSNAPSVFDTTFLQKIKTLTSDLSELPQVEDAQSLPTMKEWRLTPFGLMRQRSLLQIDTASFAFDSLRLVEDPRVRNLLLSDKGDVLTIFLEIKANISENATDSLIYSINELCEAEAFESFHLGGDVYTQVSYIQMLEAENIKLIPLFMIAVILVLWLLYGSFWKIVVPTISVLLGLVILYGYAAFIGRDLNISTLMYPTIMVVVGMSDLIHFYTKYQIEIENGLSKKIAILQSLKEIRGTLLLTSLTTIIGFLTISQSPSPHVQTFGLDGAVGVLLAFIIAITFTPVVLSFLPAPTSKEKNTSPLQSFFKWDKWLNAIYHFSKNNTKIVWGTTAVLLILSIIGISKINTNNYILGSINEDTELRASYTFFEKRLSGVRSFEWIIETKGDFKIDDLAVLQSLQGLENYIDSIDVVGSVFSPLTFYKSVHQLRKGGNARYYALPNNQQEIYRYNKWSDKFDLGTYLNEEKTVGRLTAKMEDVGRLKVKKINKKVRRWIANNLDDNMLAIRPTGKPLLIDRNHELLVGQMATSLSIAFVLISLIMAFLFRSTQMVLISLVPNLLPLILVAGVMGFTGVELNGSVSIIFTIAFVIAVDDTIHFLSKFKQEVKKYGRKPIAIQNTLLQTGKAIIITSIILMSGYFILFFSDFKEAWYHGVLICFTLFWAVLADLFLLPLLLRTQVEEE